jgi:hypothetical protein
MDLVGWNIKKVDDIIEAGPGNEARHNMFKKISKIKKNDHPVLKDIKS